ncbi:MAG TPA: endospore germination permease [Acetivibrio sp.]|uniref:GerAB/ArcD/ProY family transporter n=1 Tax=Acetivibrio sp. TaxID=1872092 RepID=UPI002B9AE179|nr:endospore germination permease [Acetivibrio sp.]HOM02526.1 endospore germination permease [Acetivibrio sp.]
MEGKVIFGKREAISILLVLICNQLILGFPSIMSNSVGSAGWIMTIYVSIITLCLFLIMAKLYSAFEGKDLLDIGEFVGGNIIRIIVGLLVVIDTVFLISIKLREYTEHIKIISFTQSPVSFITLFFTLGMIISVYYGIEPLVRSASIVVPVVAVGIIIVVAGSVKNFEFSNIMPILGTGPYDIFVGGLPRISIYSGLLPLFFIPPFMGGYKDIKEIGILAIIISSVVLTLGILAYLLVFPYPTSANSVLPFFELSRVLEYGRFFQRIESVFLLTWSLAGMIYLSSGLYFIVYVFSKTFRLKYYRPLIIPFTLIIFASSLIPKSLIEIMYIDNKIIRYYSWIITFGMTLILLVIARLVKRKKRGMAKNGK